ncbi:MAG: YraN family protein [Candidatus Kapaibacterium sp.]|nr:YraN family protein [Bacteroidota bacterium]
MNSNSNRTKGSRAEQEAVAFLISKGYSIVKKNFTFGKNGEIDIIAKDSDTLVFVEVKARTSDEYGTPEDAITPRKRQQIRKVAQGYLYVNNIEDVQCRFDVIAIQYENGQSIIRHWENAFW